MQSLVNPSEYPKDVLVALGPSVISGILGERATQKRGTPKPLHRSLPFSGTERDVERIRVLFDETLPDLSTEQRSNLFSCALELVTNGLKANLKHVFFRSKGWSTEDLSRRAERIAFFRSHCLIGSNFAEYTRRAEENGLSVGFLLSQDRDNTCIEVRNSLPLTTEDANRIKHKINCAATCKDLFEFHDRFSDRSEGEGLGLALVIFVLKNAGIDPGFLHIREERDTTIATLSIPNAALRAATRTKTHRA
ncbi:MAG: hypothetical protein K8S54_04260 [Spirochaetia bacterium]|nr:hypothetical protein [Spirochaetia bacterium]